jgi:hypothetical protein
MGWGERNNPNSTWYKKRHPEAAVKPAEIVPAALTKPKNKFITKLRKFFYLPT